MELNSYQRALGKSKAFILKHYVQVGQYVAGKRVLGLGRKEFKREPDKRRKVIYCAVIYSKRWSHPS